MRAHLKFCRVPACVFVSRSFNRTELYVVCRLVGIYVRGEGGFEKYMAFFPVNIVFEVDFRRVFIESYALYYGA